MRSLIFAFLIILFTSPAFAAEAPVVKLGGKIDTQMGHREQKGRFNNIDSDPANGRVHDFAIVNNTRVKVNADGKTDSGLKYGAHVELYADSSKNSDGRAGFGDKVWGYVESNYGKIEAGSVKSSAHQMRFHAGTIASATGGIDGDSRDWIAQKTADNFSIGDRYILTPGLPSFCDCKSAANKISYFTPKYNGAQIGVSYTPDVQFFGTASTLHSVNKTSGDQFRSITALGLKYEGDYKDVEFGLSAVGEIGRAKDSTVDRRNLKSYELGAKATYNKISIAGSFNDRRYSGEPVIKLANAKYGGNSWTFGAAYEYKDWNTSVTYLNSKRSNLYTNNVPATTAGHDITYNKLEAVSFGVDYKLIEGMMPYIEYTIFDFTRGTSNVSENYAKVLLVGSKLTF